MPLIGKTFGLLGALPGLPRRAAARGVAAHGGALRHGVTRKTDVVVLGPTLLDRWSSSAIEETVAEHIASGRTVLGARQFVDLLRGALPSSPLALDLGALGAQSGLTQKEARLLALFGGFDGDGNHYSFADAILARKYAGLITNGATWHAIARSLRSAGPATSLTAFALHSGSDGTILAERGDVVSALDGQMLLPLGKNEAEDVEAAFEAAEEAEGGGEFAGAARLYRRCLALDPSDSVAAYNLGNCLLALGRPMDARQMFIRAIQRDPTFVEAWFNLAILLREAGAIAIARDHLLRALAIDPDYGDAIYNLAALEFSAGRYDAARNAWVRYREFDADSEWALAANRGIRFVDQYNARKAASG